MAEAEGVPAVALLFADADLGAHLREALRDLGARIVHEGPATEVHSGVLADSGADVVVVNLEAAEEDHIEQLYDALSEGPFRVVFNDAEASRELSGWDRARWARHLAVKLLGYGDVDPPRPEGARAVEMPPAASAAEAGVSGNPGVSEVDAAPADTAGPPAAAVAAGEKTLSEARDTLRAQSLESELEALLAESVQDVQDGGVGETGSEVPEEDPDFSSSAQVEARQTVATSAPASDWELVDFDAAPPLPPPVPDASQFGIEKVDAVDYLSPEGGDPESELQPGLSLELVSLEASVAPAMVDETDVATGSVGDFGMVSRVAVLCVGSDETPEAGRFLAALPDTLRLPLLVVQHQEQQGAEELADALGTMTRLSVRVASDGARVGPGQVWLAPAGQQCRLARDGRLELSAGGESALGDPSMDQCLLALAEVFGAHVTVIVLAGKGRDAVAGAHVVHDRGGEVWVQDPATCDEGSMAGIIHAEGLATRSGTPAELAAHLHEEYT